jgi:hypothetical protein
MVLLQLVGVALVLMRVVVLLLLAGLAVGEHGLLLLPVVGHQVKVVRAVLVVHLEPLMAQVVAVAQVQLVARVLVLRVAMVALVLRPRLLERLLLMQVVVAEVAS